MKIQTIIAAGLLFGFTLPPAAAQNVTTTPTAGNTAAVVNSLGAIDDKRAVTVTGTVKYVRLVGERSRIQLLVTDQQGHVQEWSLEGPRGGAFAAFGQRTRMIQQFDKISVVLHPLKDNSAGGETVSLAAAN